MYKYKHKRPLKAVNYFCKKLAKCSILMFDRVPNALLNIPVFCTDWKFLQPSKVSSVHPAHPMNFYIGSLIKICKIVKI